MINLKIKKDKKKRYFFKTKESTKTAIKLILRKKNLLLEQTLKCIYLNQIYANQTNLKNHCVLTGRSHSVNRKTKLSRIKFRELALRGSILGIKKATW